MEKFPKIIAKHVIYSINEDLRSIRARKIPLINSSLVGKMKALTYLLLGLIVINQNVFADNSFIRPVGKLNVMKK